MKINVTIYKSATYRGGVTPSTTADTYNNTT